jgi:hypothetical protein
VGEEVKPHAFINLALDGGEYLVSSFGPISLTGNLVSVVHEAGWVTDGLDLVTKIKASVYAVTTLTELYHISPTSIT